MSIQGYLTLNDWGSGGGAVIHQPGGCVRACVRASAALYCRMLWVASKARKVLFKYSQFNIPYSVVLRAFKACCHNIYICEMQCVPPSIIMSISRSNVLLLSRAFLCYCRTFLQSTGVTRRWVSSWLKLTDWSTCLQMHRATTRDRPKAASQ